MVSGQITGIAELERKLNRLEESVKLKHMRSAAMFATGPTVKQMKAAAPRGTQSHRTYKGRLVAPTFLSRSVVRSTKKERGKLVMRIGVKKEAFYGVTFLDEGISVTERRVDKGEKQGRLGTRTKLTKVKVKPYKIKARHWFQRTFDRNLPQIKRRFEQKFAERLSK